jgi:uncharacterized protein YceK
MKRALAALALALALLPGCGTVLSFDPVIGEDWRRDPLFYSGTRFDVDLGSYALLDVPFSFVADTALLPFTIPQSLITWTRGRRPR